MTVVLGFIPTPEGDAALRAAVGEARRRAARLVVVNTSSGAAHIDNRYVLDDELPALEASLGESGVEYTLEHAISGREAAESVLEAAQRERAELIVIGLRRRTPVGKLIMGSTAQRILLGADCHVLAVKADRADAG